MNMLLRLLAMILSARMRARCSPLGPCLTPFIVWPTDLDVFRHMNNGVYFSIMDLARVDMLIRSGLMRRMRDAALVPIVAAETIRFRRPLRLFQRYFVETRVMGWDDNAFLMEQRFLRRSRRGVMEVLAEAIVRARFLSNRKAIPASAFLQVIGQPEAVSPELPAWVSSWNTRQAQSRDGDKALYSDMRP